LLKVIRIGQLLDFSPDKNQCPRALITACAQYSDQIIGIILLLEAAAVPPLDPAEDT
jgi:hypothetical protein